MQVNITKKVFRVLSYSFVKLKLRDNIMQKRTILVLSGYKNNTLITEDSAVLILMKDSKSKLKSGCYATNRVAGPALN